MPLWPPHRSISPPCGGIGAAATSSSGLIWQWPMGWQCRKRQHLNPIIPRAQGITTPMGQAINRVTTTTIMAVQRKVRVSLSSMNPVIMAMVVTVMTVMAVMIMAAMANRQEQAF